MAQVSVKAEEKVNIIELCAQLAKDSGVEYMFSLIGGNSGTMDSYVQRVGIKRVHVRHEQSAGFAMDAWGRLSRRPALCVIGPGTGVTNFSTGVVQAMAAGAPGVAMVAESGTMDDDKFGSQGLARSEHQYEGICKWTRRVTHPENLLFQFKRAFRSSVTPPTGPCIIGYTNEIGGPGVFIPRSQAYINFTPGYLPLRDFETLAAPRLVQELLKWLLDAERPVMLVGHAAHQDDCQDELREFVHLLGIPTNARRVARGIISEEDPLSYQKARGQVVAQADRCLVFGLRVMSFLEGFGTPPYYPVNVRYAQVHDTPEMTDLGLRTDIELIGNLKEVLKQMIGCAKDMGINKPVEKWGKWRQFVVDTVQTVEKRTKARAEKVVHQTPVHPDLVGRYTSEILSEKYHNDYITIIDALAGSTYYTGWNVAVNTGTVLDAAETIGLGHAPGMAIAAGLYTKCKKPIIALMGDGAIGCGGMEIDTACRWGIPAVFIHENNNTLATGFFDNFYAKVAAPTGNLLRDSFRVMPDVRYDKVFAEMGCHPEFVERPEQLKPALERAIEVSLREQKPSFVECFVDPNAYVSMQYDPYFMLMFTPFLTWDQIPESGRKHLASIMIPAVIPMLPKDWQEGMTAYQKK